MNSILRFPSWKPLAAAAAFLLPGLLASAQTIPNPSFEADTYTNFPGYSSGNGGVITGWTSSKPASTGLNPSGGSPFADNGTIPAGAKVAFLQSNGAGTDLNTTISGLTPGTAYRVSFRANARANQNPTLKVSIDGTSVNTSVDFAAAAPGGVITSVTGGPVQNPYHYVSFNFTAAGSAAALTLVNDALGDNTLCVDDFGIALSSDPLPPAIVGTRWTGDADSGVDSGYRYSHAWSLGGSSWAKTINGVCFSTSHYGNPSVPGSFSTGGLPNPFGDQGRNISGDSNILGKSFLYGGPNIFITLNGLKPNTTYVATVYGVDFDAFGTDRSAQFSGTAGGTPQRINLDSYGPNNGITVRYRYTTDGSGSPVTINYSQGGAVGSWHTSGFSNREFTASAGGPNPWSYTAWTGNATTGINSDAVYTHAYNLGSGSNPLINGVPFTGRPGGNPSAANFSTNGFGGVFTGDGNNVTGGGASQLLATDFVYDGWPGRLTLAGLTPGTEYLLSLFSVGWDPPGVRRLIFNGPAGCLTVDQDNYDNNNGIRVDYRYTADATGSVTITTSPLQDATFHLYGFCNREYFYNPHLQILSQPENAIVTALGQPASFSVFADGAQPLTYQWRKGDPAVDILGATGTTFAIPSVSDSDAGVYSVAVTGSAGQGTVYSINAHLYIITDRVAGLFDTGMGNNCAVLADGGQDPHYIITVNADGAPLIPGIVEDSTVFPIVTGPWVANTALSKWIGPRVETSGAAGGDYTYRTTFNLTGFDLGSVRITGNWATDNAGLDIVVNGVSTGLTNGAQFPVFTSFVLSSSNASLQNGVNTLEFRLNNASPGYTGLRLQGLQGYGSIAPGTVPYIATQPVNTSIARNATGCLSVSAAGSAPLSYQWYKEGFPIPGATASTLSGAATSYAVAGNYTVVVTNGSGSVTSDVAVVTIPDGAPVANDDGLATAMDTPVSFPAASLTANDTDPEADVLTVTGVDAASLLGGTVSLLSGTVTYTPPPGYTGTDAFYYTLDDGWGGTAQGFVQINVYANTAPALHEFTYSSTPTTQDFSFRGIPGASYKLQRATDLTGWTDLSTMTAPFDGVGIILFQDAAPPTPRAQYRIIWP